MPRSLELRIKSTMLDRERTLTIDPDFLEFDDQDQISREPTKFLKLDIEAMRYGVKWIRGYKFYIGRIYCIDIRNKAGQIIKIRLKSIYRIRRKQLSAKYSQIVKAVFDNFMRDISREYFRRFLAGQDFEILGVRFSQETLSFGEYKEGIPWLIVGTRNYRSYYAIYSLNDPNNYKAFEYLNDWNTVVLFSVSRQVLKYKGLPYEQ